MGNKKLVQILMPYLHKTNINEYVESRINDVDIGKRNVDIVKEILELSVLYKLQK